MGFLEDENEPKKKKELQRKWKNRKAKEKGKKIENLKAAKKKKQMIWENDEIINFILE